jgi:hypothetical protein
MRRFGAILVSALASTSLASSARAETLQMEYDYGLEPGEVEIGLLNYLTNFPGTQILGQRVPYRSGTTSTFYESILDVRLQLSDDWTTVLKAPMQLSKYETKHLIEYGWGPGDVEWTNHYRVLGDREDQSVMLALTVKLPTGNKSLELGTGTTDLEAGILIHQAFDPIFDTYLEVEYARAFLGRDTLHPQGDIFMHNAGFSATFGDLQIILEALGTLTTAADGPKSGAYLLEIAPGILYQLVHDKLWASAAVVLPAIQNGNAPEYYNYSFNVSLYWDTTIF